MRPYPEWAAHNAREAAAVAVAAVAVAADRLAIPAHKAVVDRPGAAGRDKRTGEAGHTDSAAAAPRADPGRIASHSKAVVAVAVVAVVLRYSTFSLSL